MPSAERKVHPPADFQSGEQIERVQRFVEVIVAKDATLPDGTRDEPCLGPSNPRFLVGTRRRGGHQQAITDRKHQVLTIPCRLSAG